VHWLFVFCSKDFDVAKRGVGGKVIAPASYTVHDKVVYTLHPNIVPLTINRVTAKAHAESMRLEAASAAADNQNGYSNGHSRAPNSPHDSNNVGIAAENSSVLSPMSGEGGDPGPSNGVHGMTSSRPPSRVVMSPANAMLYFSVPEAQPFNSAKKATTTGTKSRASMSTTVTTVTTDDNETTDKANSIASSSMLGRGAMDEFRSPAGLDQYGRPKLHMLSHVSEGISRITL